MSDVTYHDPSTSVEPAIRLTQAATSHVLAYLAKHDESQGIRLSVKKTGCSGLSYVVDYVHEPKPDDLVLALDTTYSIYLDKKSYPFLNGTQIDYVKQGLNYQFVFKNPNQTGQCGCGESFTVA